jgi:hypothetical protein
MTLVEKREELKAQRRAEKKLADKKANERNEVLTKVIEDLNSIEDISIKEFTFRVVCYPVDFRLTRNREISRLLGIANTLSQVVLDEHLAEVSVVIGTWNEANIDAFRMAYDMPYYSPSKDEIIDNRDGNEDLVDDIELELVLEDLAEELGLDGLSFKNADFKKLYRGMLEKAEQDMVKYREAHKAQLELEEQCNQAIV